MHSKLKFSSCGTFASCGTFPFSVTYRRLQTYSTLNNRSRTASLVCLLPPPPGSAAAVAALTDYFSTRHLELHCLILCRSIASVSAASGGDVEAHVIASALAGPPQHQPTCRGSPGWTTSGGGWARAVRPSLRARGREPRSYLLPATTTWLHPPGVNQGRILLLHDGAQDS